MIRPILRWIHYSRIIIKSYYKSLDLQFNQLNLLDQQDYDSSDEEEEASSNNEESKEK